MIIDLTMFKGPFWSRYIGKIFIGFLSFIAINSLVFIIIGDKLKCDKNETYTPDTQVIKTGNTFIGNSTMYGSKKLYC